MQKYECAECRALFRKEDLQRVKCADGKYHLVCPYCMEEKGGKEDTA